VSIFEGWTKYSAKKIEKLEKELKSCKKTEVKSVETLDEEPQSVGRWSSQRRRGRAPHSTGNWPRLPSARSSSPSQQMSNTRSRSPRGSRASCDRAKAAAKAGERVEEANEGAEENLSAAESEEAEKAQKKSGTPAPKDERRYQSSESSR